MMEINVYSSDIETILSHRYDQGADLWTTPDQRLIKGSPYSTIECALYLLELGMSPDDPVLKAVAELIFQKWQDDRRFRVYPEGSIYPCQTVAAAKALCHLGYVTDPRIQKTQEHLLEIQYQDGGWRCNKFPFGHGEETDFSNPLPTLNVLDVFRHTDLINQEPKLEKAVEFLLQHWVDRRPIGPCHYGIGTLFMQVEYPFRNYNLFEYVYVLSFYEYARQDERFQEAYMVLKGKLVQNQVVVERVVPKLAQLSFCKKGSPSESATKKFREIVKNLTDFTY